MNAIIIMSQMCGAGGGSVDSLPFYVDEKTGARVRTLVRGLPKAQVVYQTYPMWARDMAYFVFTAEHAGKNVLHARDMKTGEMRNLFDDPVGGYILEPKSGLLYYTQQNELCANTIEELFAGGTTPKKIADIPKEMNRQQGGLSLDANNETLYTGVTLEDDKKWGIVSCSLKTGQWQVVREVDFKVGHVQANPFRSGQIMFCWETGGDSPQRTWLVNADGSGLRPFYKETYDEWVTHEVWWGADSIVFTVWPYDDEHKQKPHGACGATLPDCKLDVFSQLPAWHIHASPDKKWIVVDDFDRSLWLIKAETKERRLLTQGHLGKDFETHPHPSFTPDSKSVVFNSSRNDSEQILCVEIPEWASLPSQSPASEK